MCGIVGLRVYDGRPDPSLLLAMREQLRHRGPDGCGVWEGHGVALGHRRLSIIDLAGSPQPMSSTLALCHVTFNGEILNFRQLRCSLDYPFSTQGDTEVLLAAYLRWGAAHVRRLEGQFAHAIFDERSRDLWLFRDRLGILPLYWYSRPGLFAFASEVKALLPAIGRELAVDDQRLADYLGARSVPAPNTLFKGVRKLRPGHHLRVDAEGRVEETPYWTISAEAPTKVPPKEAVRRVDVALRSSVERALVADVPVGAYLSGGLDSSLIVALMRRARPEAELLTFSAGFTNSSHDERTHASRVSRFVGSRHHEVVLGPEDFFAQWPELTYQRDAPLSEPADVAVHSLAQLARQHVKVVLSGEGSDELFGGYPKYVAARWLEPLGLLPAALRQSASRAIDVRLPPGLARLRVPVRTMGARSEADRLHEWFSPFTREERARLLGKQQPDRTLYSGSQGDLLHRMLHADAQQWLSDNLLERGDRMSMAASVELRPPFLDRSVVELAFSLPSSVKVRGGTTKWVVKEVARQYLPASIVDRQKVGFRVPLERWFRGPLQEMTHDLLLSPASWVGSTLHRPTVAALVRDHERGRRNEEIRLWTLLSLELWHRAFFGAAAPPLPRAAASRRWA